MSRERDVVKEAKMKLRSIHDEMELMRKGLQAIVVPAQDKQTVSGLVHLTKDMEGDINSLNALLICIEVMQPD